MPEGDLIRDPQTVQSTWEHLPVITEDTRICLNCSAVLLDLSGPLRTACPHCGRVWDTASIRAMTTANAISRSTTLIRLQDQYAAILARAPEDAQVQQIGWYLEALVVVAPTCPEVSWQDRVAECRIWLDAAQQRHH